MKSLLSNYPFQDVLVCLLMPGFKDYNDREGAVLSNQYADRINIFHLSSYVVLLSSADMNQESV